jgi:HK97 family phage prohead protease
VVEKNTSKFTNKLAHKSFAFELKAATEANQPMIVGGYANVSEKDRAEEIITKDAWNLGNYANNPVVLLNHDKTKIIGKAIVCEVREKGLYVELEIAKECDGCEITQAQKEAKTLLAQGYLKTFSVGFLPREAEYDKKNQQYVITNAELLEVSLVSVPCQQDSVVEFVKDFLSTKVEGGQNMALEQADLDSIKGLIDGAIAPLAEKIAAIFDKVAGKPEMEEEACKPEDMKAIEDMKAYVAKLENALVELTK